MIVLSVHCVQSNCPVAISRANTWLPCTEMVVVVVLIDVGTTVDADDVGDGVANVVAGGAVATLVVRDRSPASSPGRMGISRTTSATTRGTALPTRASSALR